LTIGSGAVSVSGSNTGDQTNISGNAATATFLSGLSDPDANTIVGWDDTDNAHKFFTLGTGLAYDHATHTISSTGSGDITSVGDVSTGAAFDGTQGTTLTFYNAGGNATCVYDGTTFTFNKFITADVTGDLTGNADTASNLSGTPALPNGTTATTQSAGDNSTKVATTAYADRKATEGAWTDYSATSTVVGWSSFTTKYITYKKIGDIVFVQIYLEGTSNSASATLTLPYANTGTILRVAGQAKDNGTTNTTNPAVLYMVDSTVIMYKDWAGNGFTASGAKSCVFEFFYRTS
jgi:hypothetical protein